MTRRERLRAAAAVIEEIAGTLDLRHGPCPCCGMTVFSERWDWQAHLELDAARKKILRIAASNVFDLDPEPPAA